jgi:hypothetical protein
MIAPVSREHNAKNLKLILGSEISDSLIVFYGTMLGMCRDKNIIDGDDDIDFYIEKAEKQKVIKVLQDLDFLITYNKEDFVQGSRVIEGVTTYVDFYLYQITPDSKYLIDKWNFFGCPHDRNAHMIIPFDLVLPYKKILLNDTVINIPNDIEGCCHFLYGERYHTPMRKNIDYRMSMEGNTPKIVYLTPQQNISYNIRRSP